MDFQIIGRMKAIKPTEKFNPVDTRTFPSGWMNQKYSFNIMSGNNRFMVQVGGGRWQDDKKNVIHTYTAGDATHKGEKLDVQWANRRDKAVIDRVAGFKKYTINIATFDEAKELGEEEAAKKRMDYIEPTDYALAIQKLLESGRFADTKFKFQGTVEVSYNAAKDLYYQTYVVTRIFKVNDDTDESALMNLNLFYDPNTALNDASFEDNKMMTFNAFTPYYFNKTIGTKYVPVTLILRGKDEKAEKTALAFKKKLTATGDTDTRNVYLVCDMIDGSDTKQVTIDDLDDETRENIDLGLITLDDALNSFGGGIVGERIRELRIKSLARKSARGPEDAVLTMDELLAKPVAVVEEKKDETDDLDDLFAI